MFSRPTKSLCSSANRRCFSSACCCLSMGRSRGSWMERAETMMSTSRNAPFASASTTIRAMRGSRGSWAILRPYAVRRLRGSATRSAGTIAWSSSRSLTPSAIWRESGGSRKGKLAMSPSPREVIWRITEARLVRQDLGVGELWSGLEILLGVQPDADAVRDPTAATGPLAGAGPRDGLDRVALHLRALAVPRDASGPGVHDIPNARHGQGGLGDVRGKDHAATGVLAEDAVLLGRRQSSEERQDLGVRQRHAAERLCGVPDLAFTGEEDQDVTGRVPVLGPQLLARP